VQFSKRRERVEALLAQWFPDREFFMRSNGEIKFLKVSARLQKRVALIVAGAVLLWLLIGLALGVNQVRMAFQQAAIDAREAKIQTSEERVAEYRDSVDEVAKDLTRRQDFLENLTESYFADDAAAAEAVAGQEDANPGDADETVKTIGALIPEAAGLARLEARQIAFVTQLSAAADRRAERAERAIRQLGLDPKQVTRADTSGQGGPFIPFFGSKKAERSLDPRFAALSDKLARMDALERSLVAMPSAKPARTGAALSSGFGYRRDPFTGRAAMHSGIDFKGPQGLPILAAATGKVSFAGRKSGYGNCVEISHGNGLVTRYAHLSKIGVRVGQRVTKGANIAAMGSTGRSTGTHLHFEVRLNGRAINPKPFLEAKRDVLKAQAVAEQRTSAPNKPA